LYERLGFERYDETETHHLLRWRSPSRRITVPGGGATSTLDIAQSHGPS
jgi:hypothetical protein